MGGGSTSGGINDPRILSDVTPDNEWIPGAQYAQNDRLGAYEVDLRKEQARGGHTIEKHVNRSREALIAQAREAFDENPSCSNFPLRLVLLPGGRNKADQLDALEKPGYR